MKYSLTLLALGATSISALAFPAPNAQSSSNCDAVYVSPLASLTLPFSHHHLTNPPPSSLGKCAQPLTQQVLDCGNSDLECLCSTVSDLIGCYDQFCPGQAPAEINDAIDACNSEGQDVADPTGGTGGSLNDSTATFASGSEKATSTGLGLDDLASETSAVETQTLVDPESTETSTARVTKTTSADDSEETSSAEPEETSSAEPEESSSVEPEETSSTSGEATGSDETVTSTRRQSGTQTNPAPTQSTGAAENLVAPVGGLLAAAIGVVALL